MKRSARRALRRLVVAVCTSLTRPRRRIKGQVIYETDTDRFLVYDGRQWVER